ncbi:MAG: hypothetical protein HY552_03860 [Elusimicrobia bacterium]|nr:hypothetical protein [Elusimicrobiota bacterium]
MPVQLVGDQPTSENRTGDWRSQRPVIDAARCTGCLICWKYCPEACVTRTDKVPVILMDYCKGCAICAAECPRDCVAMQPEEAA